MRLDVITKDQCETIRQWRNKDIVPYRTPYMLTREMQENFYNNVICDRNADSRFFALIDEIDSKDSDSTWDKITDSYECFIGMVGLVDISLENRSAEISLVIDPELRNNGYGERGVELILDHAFNHMNLDHVYGECYHCNPNLNFWLKICDKRSVEIYKLPARKFYKNDYYGSIYFNFSRESIQ